jgi:hypothetical protein
VGVDRDTCVAEIFEAPGVVEMEVAHHYCFDVLYGLAGGLDGSGKFVFGTVAYAGEDIV